MHWAIYFILQMVAKVGGKTEERIIRGRNAAKEEVGMKKTSLYTYMFEAI